MKKQNNIKNSKKRKNKLLDYFLNSSFAKSFKFEKPFLKMFYFDVAHYSIFLFILGGFVLLTKDAWPLLNSMNMAQLFSFNKLTVVASAVKNFRLYFFSTIILLIANNMFWRGFILKNYFERKERWWQFLLNAIITCVFKIMIVMMLYAFILFSIKNINATALKFIGPIIVLCFLYFYNAFIYGLSSNSKIGKGFLAVFKLLKNPHKLALSIFYAYIVFAIPLVLIVNPLNSINPYMFIISSLIVSFLFFNWARYYMFLVCSKIIAQK